MGDNITKNNPQEAIDITASKGLSITEDGHILVFAYVRTAGPLADLLLEEETGLHVQLLRFEFNTTTYNASDSVFYSRNGNRDAGNDTTLGSDTAAATDNSTTYYYFSNYTNDIYKLGDPIWVSSLANDNLTGSVEDVSFSVGIYNQHRLSFAVAWELHHNLMAPPDNWRLYLRRYERYFTAPSVSPSPTSSISYTPSNTPSTSFTPSASPTSICNPARLDFVVNPLSAFRDDTNIVELNFYFWHKDSSAIRPCIISSGIYLCALVLYVCMYESY